jgi:hypothetical protein
LAGNHFVWQQLHLAQICLRQILQQVIGFGRIGLRKTCSQKEKEKATCEK